MSDPVVSDPAVSDPVVSGPAVSGPPVSGPVGVGGRKLIRRLCGTVLGMEAVVMLLAIVPAKVLEHVHGGVAGGVGGGLALIALLLAGTVGKPGMGWALIAGSVFQIVVIAAGVLLPAMYVLGAIFGALWITGILLARRIEQQILERQQAAPSPS
jgi:hypothetical protein